MLTETVRQVRVLRRTVSALEAVCSGGSPKDCVFPGEMDELCLKDCEDEQGPLVKVTFSCEDRPGLMSTVARVLRTAKGKVVKSEMVTVGGRTKTVLSVRELPGGRNNEALKRALKVAIERTILPRSHGSLDDYKFVV